MSSGRTDLFSHLDIVAVAQSKPVERTRRTLRANYLLVENIRALLAGRGVDDKALAIWCGHRPAWLSKVLSGERGIKLPDLDKIADFFGLTVAQLFQHGISGLTERRHGERRTVGDRRSGQERRGKTSATVHPDVSTFPQREYPRQNEDKDEDVA